LYATTNGDQCDTVTSSTVLTINRAPDATILSENIENCVPFTPLFGSGATGVQNANFTWTWENEPGITDTDNDSMTQRTITDYQTTTSGIHRLQLTVSTNTTPACTSTSEWTMVTAHAVPEADFEADPPFTTIAKPFFNFINKSTIIDGSKLSYLWNLGPGPDPTRPENRKVTDANPVNIEYAADTAQKDVTLYVTSEYGCIDSVTNKIRINPDITVFIPNAFRPDSKLSNCDGDIDCNRKFKVIANGHLSVEVFVFNRWGQLVFKTTNANEGWDGKMINTSEDCPQEVYIYQVNATSFSGKLYRYSGSVTLLR
jgi:gliding motility-associated-like protein